jgi:hypothetical protein
MTMRLIRFAALSTLCAACAASPRASPTLSAAGPTPPSTTQPDEYRSVHIDNIGPGLLAQFEGARRDWLAELRRANATDGRGVFLQVGPSTFYTVRSFAKFGDFDTRGDAIERSLAAVPKAAAERYDALSDTSLVFPHTSEVWGVEADLSYAPSGGGVTQRTAACGRLVLEDLRPDPPSEKRYEGATVEMNHALAEARYPLTRATFRTVFGAGRLVTMWLAASREELDGAADVEVAVAAVRGRERAAELSAACDASIVHRETLPLVVRHDLTQ